MAGLLSDDEETPVKQAHSSVTKTTPENSGTPNEKGKIWFQNGVAWDFFVFYKLWETCPCIDTSLPTVHGHAVAPDQKQEELTFEDDGDDLMDALGFGETSKAEVKSGRRSEE